MRGAVAVGPPLSDAVKPARPVTAVLPVLPVVFGVVALTTTAPPIGGVTTLWTTTGGRLPMLGHVTLEVIETSSAVVPVVPAVHVTFPVPVTYWLFEVTVYV